MALAARICVVVALTFLSNLPEFAVDDTTYAGMAVAVVTGAAETWDEGTNGLYMSTFAFMGPVSLIYFITDSNQMVAQLYVAILGAGTAALVSLVALQFLPRRSALVAGGIVALLPSQVLWSSLLLKDASVWIVLTGLAAIVAVVGKKVGFKIVPWLIGAAVLLLVLGYLRGHTTVVAAWALAIAAFAGVREQRLRRGLAGLAVAISTPWLVGLGPGGYTFATNAGSLEYRRAANAIGANSAFVTALSRAELGGEPQVELEAIEKASEDLSRRSASVRMQLQEVQRALQLSGKPKPEQLSGKPKPELERRERRLARKLRRVEARIERVEQARLAAKQQLADAEEGFRSSQEDEIIDPNLAHLPKGLSVMLFEPVPWGRGGSSILQMARGEALLWYPLLLLAAAGLMASHRHLRVLAFPLLAGGGTLLVYALAEGNIGTAFRHRGEFVWVVALLAALGLQQLLDRRNRRASGRSEAQGG